MAINVLIVDDSQLIRQVVRKVVKQVGIDLDQFFDAADGQEALEVLAQHEVGLVLSDINMPRMDGLQMLMQLRQMEDKLDIPVIMVSTEGSEETMTEAMELGANGYVLKPFTPESLAEQLRPLGLVPETGTADAEPDLDDPMAF